MNECHRTPEDAAAAAAGTALQVGVCVDCSYFSLSPIQPAVSLSAAPPGLTRTPVYFREGLTYVYFVLFRYLNSWMIVVIY